MDVTDSYVTADEASIDFGGLFSALRRGWLIIVITTVAAVLGAVIYLHGATYTYTASMVVAPAQSTGSDGLSSRLGQLGGLASAVGVSLPEGSNSSSFKLYIEGLKSYAAAEVLAGDPAIMHALFDREWDDKARQWRQPGGSLRGFINGAKDIMGIPNLPWRAPDASRVQALLETELVVEVNARSPVIVLRFAHKDPQFAKLFLTRIDDTVDRLLRQRTLLRTNDYISYLTAKLRTVELAEQRVSITQTLGEQERLRMAASSTLPFAADVFSGPSATPRPTSPRPYMLLTLAVLGGLGLGILIVLVRARSRARTLPAV